MVAHRPNPVNDQYLTIAMQYYIAGRSAMFAQSLPVVGNLLHHAIEMFLKFLLSKDLTSEQMKKQFGHDLNKLWAAIKSNLNDPSLERFDGMVSDINQYEELRYPTSKGAAMRFAIFKNTGPRLLFDSNTKLYDLCLEDVDELVGVLLKNRVTPEWIKMLLGNATALEHYTKDNRHPFFQISD